MAEPLFTVQKVEKYSVVEFRTNSLMNPSELEQIATDLYRLVDEEDRRYLVLDFERHVPSPQRNLGRLPRATEARVNTKLECNPGELGSEADRLRLALSGQLHRHGRVAVHMVRDVQLRLTVTGENDELHTASLRLP